MLLLSPWKAPSFWKVGLRTHLGGPWQAVVTFVGLSYSTVSAPAVWLENYSMNILNAGEGVLFVTDVCVCVCVCV